ncbi:MAG TPA: RagB/SusD family nutrient uptake outer membrane protein [Prolixibacteraceae bacterium]|nr:RagB/SusD family nutrient uptake outer membrane protein [Prolixibacteraceae bacterium]
MKITKISFFILMVFCFTSCNKYLDQVPSEKLNEDVLFNSKDDVVKVLTQIYAYYPSPIQFRDTPGLAADECDLIWTNYSPYVKDIGGYSQGNPIYDNWAGLYNVIRSSQYFLARIDECKDEKLTEQERTWWKGEAEFLQAYYYYLLLEQYGPVPLIKKVYTGSELDASMTAGVPRSSADKVINYIDSLCVAASEKLDVTYSIPDRAGRANATAALFLRARVALYAASPLYNGLKNPTTGKTYTELAMKDDKGADLLNTTFDGSKWQKARDYASDAMTLGATGGYGIYMGSPTAPAINPGLDAYKKIFTWTRGGEPSVECIFYKQNQSSLEFIQHSMPISWSWYSGICPTLEHVNEYFTANGLLPEDDSQWVNATGFYTYSSGGFSVKIFNRFRNRDPRFYANILFPGQYNYAMLEGDKEVTNSKWANNATDAKNFFRPYYDGQDGFKSKTGRDYSINGFQAIKWTARNVTNTALGEYAVPIFRYSELILNFVEAAFESDVAKGVDPLTDTELFDAWDKIRDRVKLPRVKDAYATAVIPLTIEKLRELIHRERRVELAFEGHRYFDNRRWLDAEREGGDKHGMDINKTDDDGFWNENYVFETRYWNNKMYFMPILQSEIDKNKRLTQNPLW